MNKNNRGLPPLVLVALLIGSLVLVGCDNQESPQAAPPAPKVGVVTLQAETLNITTELPGRTNAFRIAEIRPQVGGIILKREFIEGSDVVDGELLYQIDPATYQAAYNTAKGNLAKARASADIANLTLKRYQPLLKTNYLSRQEYDSQVAIVQEAAAAVESASAALESARINLQYTTVKSPISGRIGKSNFTEGALVTAGQANPLAMVQQLDPIYVDITQSSTDLLNLKKELATGKLAQVNGKAAVALKLDDGTIYPHKGTLEFSEVNVDEATGSVTLRAIFPNPDKVLLPGMFVKAIVNNGVREEAILAPQLGVTRTPRGQASVMVVNQEGKTENRVIKVGKAIGDKWLVNEGLQAGDRLIVTGLVRLRPGVSVTAEEYKQDQTQVVDNSKASAK